MSRLRVYLRSGRRRDMIWRMFLETTVGPQQRNCSNLFMTCWYTASYARRSSGVKTTVISCSLLGGSLSSSLPLNFCCFVCRIIICFKDVDACHLIPYQYISPSDVSVSRSLLFLVVTHLLKFPETFLIVQPRFFVLVRFVTSSSI